MILKLILGRGFRGALSYVSTAAKSATTDHTDPVAPLFTNMAGQSPRELAAEFGTLRKLRPNLTKAVGHLILSHNPTQRQLTEKEWKEAIQIALKTHGADQAAFAAWSHHDTGTTHCHVIFSRVLITNEVVSDSNSYRKNEAAARQIERTFMLDAPIPTPPADKPGDRKAIYNASKRAERTGTLDPTSISNQTVREALAAAKSVEDYKLQLERRDIEIEFDRRGAKQEIYGCRLRRRGAQEWLKASSIHKDLSWPKIAHRFNSETETNKAEQDQEARVIEEARLDEDRADDRAKEQDRRPAMIRNSLSLQSRPKLDIDLPKTTHNIARADIGPVTKVMLVIGMAALKLSAAAVEALKNFILWILRKIGLMLAPAALGSAQAKTALPFEPRYIDVESRVVPEPVTPNAIENAANELMKVADALKKNDPDLLPPGQGREELAAALVAEQSPFSIPPADDRTVEIQAPSEIKQDGLNELFSNPKSPFFRELDKLIDDALAALDRAVKAQQDAESAINDTPKLDADEVIEAKQKLILAEQKLAARENEHYFQKAEAPKLLRFAFPSAESFSAKEIAAVEAAKAVLAGVQKAHPAEVPEHLNVALLQARLGSIRAAEIALNEQKKLLSTMKADNPDLLKVANSRVDFFASQVKLLGNHPSTHFARLALKSGEDAIKSIAEKRIEIEETARREVQKALEASLQKHVPRNDYVDDADAPGG